MPKKLKLNMVDEGPLTEYQKKLVAGAVKLVDVYRRKYLRVGMDKDLASYGYMGLIHAAKKFEPEKGFKFNTYAKHWVRAYMQLCITDYWSVVRHKDRDWRSGMDLRPRDAVIDHHNDFSFGTTDSVENEYLELEKRELINKLVASLEPRDRKIVRHLYNDDLTQQATSDRVGVSRERVRQLNVRILENLREKIVEQNLFMELNT